MPLPTARRRLLAVVTTVVAAVAVIALFAVIYNTARGAAVHENAVREGSDLASTQQSLTTLVSSARKVDDALTAVTTASPATMSAGLALTLTNSELALAASMTSAQRPARTVGGVAKQASALNLAVASAGVAVDQIDAEYQEAAARAIAAAPAGNQGLVRALNASVTVLTTTVRIRSGVRSAIDVVALRMAALAAAPHAGNSRAGSSTPQG